MQKEKMKGKGQNAYPVRKNLIFRKIEIKCLRNQFVSFIQRVTTNALKYITQKSLLLPSVQEKTAIKDTENHANKENFADDSAKISPVNLNMK